MSSLTMDDDVAAEQQQHDQVVEINCGGVVFQTYKSTLVNGSTYFQAYFSGKFAIVRDKNDRVFLDMDPEWFRPLLNRMRFPDYKFSSDLQGALRNAADYLGVEWLSLSELEQSRAEKKAQLQRTTNYNLLLRIEPGDRVEVLSMSKQWLAVEMVTYDRFSGQAWQFQQVQADKDGSRQKFIRDIMNVERIRVTDETLLDKILSRPPYDYRAFRISDKPPTLGLV